MANISYFPQPFELLRLSFLIYKKYFLRLIAITAIPVIAGQLVPYVFELVFDNNFDPSQLNSLLPLITGLIVIVSLLIIQFWGQAALLLAVINLEKNLNPKSLFVLAWPKTFPYFLLYLQSLLLVIAGLISFIFPGLMFYVITSLAAFILLEENVNSLTSILKGSFYLQTRVTRVIAGYILFGILYFVVVVILGNVIGGNETELSYNLYQFILNLLVLPFILVFNYLNYSFLKSGRRELFVVSPQSRFFYIFLMLMPLIAAIVLILLYPHYQQYLWQFMQNNLHFSP